jgi:hypothetical protein
MTNVQSTEDEDDNFDLRAFDAQWDTDADAGRVDTRGGAEYRRVVGEAITAHYLFDPEAIQPASAARRGCSKRGCHHGLRAQGQASGAAAAAAAAVKRNRPALP